MCTSSFIFRLPCMYWEGHKMSLDQVKLARILIPPRIRRKQHIGIDSGVESTPSNVSSQKFTCPVTCNHLSMKVRERLIQKTRTHYKTTQEPFLRGSIFLHQAQSQHTLPKLNLEVINVRKNKSTWWLIVLSLHISSLSTLILCPWNVATFYEKKKELQKYHLGI